MRRCLAFLMLALCLPSLLSQQASAESGAAHAFLPFGFYQPYGASYQGSLRRPPYFATNPPVYYGSRHVRPYGLSPFAAPPLLQSSVGYRSVRSSLNPPVTLPQSASEQAINRSGSADFARAGEFSEEVSRTQQTGPIRINPFASSEDALAIQ
ncbi:hypothetical protein OAA27_02000 [bacterium]|nr:hypothetical protein [Rubripirellula sp.]MDB4331821.1 hypothetical protein [bacterium]MDB4338777.1 hypothetical protein [Rubripirellula sp.]